MGFEVVYHYHERIDGEYKKDETKTLKKKVGDPYGESDHQKLAISILGQLARRDIWVVDVEIFEFTKKQLSFKEVEGGVKINNRKYKLSDAASLIVAEEETELVQTPQLPQVSNGQALHPHELLAPQRPRRPIKFVTFEPNPRQLAEAQQKGLKFTPGKTYAVFEENELKNSRGEYLGLTYRTLDDAGREIEKITEDYFVPQLNLAFDKEVDFSNNKNKQEGNLLFQGAVEDGNMIDIRRR